MCAHATNVELYASGCLLLPLDLLFACDWNYRFRFAHKLNDLLFICLAGGLEAFSIMFMESNSFVCSRMEFVGRIVSDCVNLVRCSVCVPITCFTSFSFLLHPEDTVFALESLSGRF